MARKKYIPTQLIEKQLLTMSRLAARDIALYGIETRPHNHRSLYKTKTVSSSDIGVFCELTDHWV